MNRRALAFRALVCLFAGVGATQATACYGPFDVACNMTNGGLALTTSPARPNRQHMRYQTQ